MLLPRDYIPTLVLESSEIPSDDHSANDGTAMQRKQKALRDATLSVAGLYPRSSSTGSCVSLQRQELNSDSPYKAWRERSEFGQRMGVGEEKPFIC